MFQMKDIVLKYDLIIIIIRNKNSSKKKKKGKQNGKSMYILKYIIVIKSSVYLE